MPFFVSKPDGPEVPRQGQRAHQHTQIQKHEDTHARQGMETEHRKTPPQKWGRGKDSGITHIYANQHVFRKAPTHVLTFTHAHTSTHAACSDRIASHTAKTQTHRKADCKERRRRWAEGREGEQKEPEEERYSARKQRADGEDE